eukprot:scaffold11700_cov124-Isochrysis_galbana.AAC.3
MADNTPQRRLAANVARQREVGSMVVSLGVGGDWPAVLEQSGLLRPSDLLKAPGMQHLLAEPDWTKLSAVAQAALGRTQRKLSDAADAWAAASGRARTLPPVDSDELLEQLLEVARDMAASAKRAEEEGLSAGLGVMSAEDKRRFHEEAVAKGRVQAETKEAEPAKFHSNWKDANGNVPMAGADVACEDALKAVWTGTASTSPYLPGLLSGIGWGTERKPPIVERDRRTGRVIGTRRGKGCEPTLLEIVAETTRAMNAMGLGWCLRIGPGQTAAHITVDAALDEYAQDPAGGPMYLGCSPPMLQLFKDKYREAVLEAESCAWDQAEDLANTVWNA